jgi:hypothetical protein
MLISIGAYDLCNGTVSGGFAASDMRLRFTRGIEIVLGLDLTSPQTFDRETRTLDLSFNVMRVHASIRASELFIGNHENEVPQAGVVKLVTQNGTTAFVANGVLVNIQLVNEIGATTKHAYRIIGGVFDVHAGRPQTLNQVIITGISIGLWPTISIPTPTTLIEVIDAGSSLGLWPSGPVPSSPTSLTEVIAAGTALDLWL